MAAGVPLALSTAASQKIDRAAPPDDPAVGDRVLLADRAEVAHVHGQREHQRDLVEAGADGRDDDGVDEGGDGPAVHRPRRLLELGPEGQAQPAVVDAQLLDLDADERREVVRSQDPNLAHVRRRCSGRGANDSGSGTIGTGIGSG